MGTNSINVAFQNTNVTAANPLPVVTAAGTATIGKLGANSGVDIGDVDVLSIAAGENHLGEVGGKMLFTSTTFTRPADTTAYAAKDAVGDSTSAPTVLSFTNAVRISGGTGYVVGARINTSQTTCVARFRLHLFRTTPTAINDNGAFTLLDANFATRLGYIDFAAMQTEGTGSTAANSQNATVRLPIVCGATTLFGLLESLDAFTPASAQTFKFELAIEGN